MAKTTAPAALDFTVVAEGLPKGTRVDPTTNPFYAAVEHSRDNGVALSAPVTDLKSAHQLIRRAATALGVGVKIRPSITTEVAEGESVVVTFVAGAKRGTGTPATA